MEKLRNTGSIRAKSKERKARLAASFLAAGAVLAATAPTEGKEPYVYAPVPHEDFYSVILNNEFKDKDLIITIPSPAPVLSREELSKQKVDNELKDILSKMDEHKDLFSEKYIQDVEMYYPIYKAVADKYKIDWYLLWIVHEKETGASAGTRGFAQDSYYKDAMQIAPFWQKYADQASKGLEDLKKLPQRHKNDWEQIALGAWILNRNIDKKIENGGSMDDAVHNALVLYSADGPAEKRFAMYESYKKIFGS